MLIGRGMMGECTMRVDVGKGQDGHSCNGHFGNARVPLEKVGFLGMGVQNAQLGYIIEKPLNCQSFKSF